MAEVIISVVCPVLNEGKYVQRLVDFFVNSRPFEKELIFIDGGSTDDTISIVEQNCKKYSNIRLLHNPKKIVPVALNIAIPECQGKYIVRLDGHSRYAEDYFEQILRTFSEIDAGIVGGPTRTEYHGSTQEAIAFAVSHPVGIGGSRVHNEEYRGYTDSVTFGAWKKEIFEVTGLFDERLVRNQDDEFHYRAKSLGVKIYQNPDIKLYYLPRSSFPALFRQYFQYGLYKPMVLRKIKSEAKLRHIVPSLFVIYLTTLIFLLQQPYLFLPLAGYALLVCSIAWSSGRTSAVRFKIAVAIPCIHIAYGAGFLLGLLRRS